MNLVDDTVVNTKTESLWMCSLVASEGSRFNSGHYLGVVGVAGSNPAVPTRSSGMLMGRRRGYPNELVGFHDRQ